MLYAGLLSLLMPTGIWLLQSAATPRDQEARVAATGLLVLVTAALAYIATGFAIMFGGIGNLLHTPEFGGYTHVVALPVIDQNWGLFGLHGFFLSDAANVKVFALLISYLPLSVSSAMLMSSALGTRARLSVHLVFAAVISGVLFPVTGYWLWGGGWLAALGTNLNLGHGAVDIGGLSSAALVAGSAGLAWLVLGPRRAYQENPQLPDTHFPFRAVSGIVLLLIGSVSYVAGNPLYPQSAVTAINVMALNSLVAVSMAIMLAVAYSVFASRRIDVLLASRAALAALILVGMGGFLLPPWTAVIAALIAVALSTIGYFYINEVLRLQDDAGAISAWNAPALFGALLSGLFASGSFTAGWNGVGTDGYLGITNLGVTGALPGGAVTGDPGQLTAQITSSLVLLAFSTVAALPVAWLLRVIGARRPVVSQPEMMPLGKSDAVTADIGVAVPVAAPRPAVVPAAAAEGETAEQHIIPSAATQSSILQPEAAPSVNQLPPVPEQKITPVARQNGASWFDKLRALRNRNKQPDAPVQPRYVAYPTRAGGRRILMRPISKAAGEPPAGTEGSKPAS